MSRLFAALSLCFLCALLPAQADERLREGRARISGDRIHLDDRVYFEFDSHNLDRGSAPVLQDVARLINKNPDITRVEIRGHTDSQGPADYNRELSHRRAQEVRRFLIQHGVSHRLLAYQGFGEDQPLIPGESERAYATNRRVEFVINRR